jgi:hypothetical protein
MTAEISVGQGLSRRGRDCSGLVLSQLEEQEVVICRGECSGVRMGLLWQCFVAAMAGSIAAVHFVLLLLAAWLSLSLYGCACMLCLLFASAHRSGDVGIGLNARRLRERFTNRFNITYSLRPVGELGTVFRRYPEQWKVFVEEPSLPGR